MSEPTPAPDEVLVTRDGTYASADFKEGVRAFLEKRSPRWSGT